MADLPRRLVAEALGTGTLVCGVVGSGTMADRLTDDIALALLCNSIATGAILVVLVTIFRPISGAHFNPAVSLVMALRREMTVGELGAYILCQVAGGVAGTVVAHAMFDLPLLQLSDTDRSGPHFWFAEFIATFGLIAVILSCLRFDPKSLAWAVGLYITAAYWFTASTSFANPAVTVARAFTDTFSGIGAIDVPAFVAAQMVGAVVASSIFAWLLRSNPPATEQI